MNTERLAPENFRKIAQNDSATGVPVAAVYHDPIRKEFFITAQCVLPNGEFGNQAFGPIPMHTFNNLMHILDSVKEMDGRYVNID